MEGWTGLLEHPKEKSKVLMQQLNVLWLRCNKSCRLSSAYQRRGGVQVHIRFRRLLLVEVFASCRQARQLFIEDIFLGAHAVTFHVLCPVQLTHIKIEHLQCKKKRNTRDAVRKLLNKNMDCGRWWGHSHKRTGTSVKCITKLMADNCYY